MTKIKFYLVLFFGWIFIGNQDLMPDPDTPLDLDEHETKSFH